MGKFRVLGKDLINQQIGFIRDNIPDYIERMHWSREQIEQFKLDRLIKILKTSKEKSKWHAKRLESIDIDNFKLSDLHKLPSMDKLDLMNNWDSVVTDKNLKLDIANSLFNDSDRFTHKVFLDKYHFWASGGSTGTRGMFVWSAEDYAHFVCGTYRQRLNELTDLEKSLDPLIKASIVARDRIHMSNYLWGLPVLPKMQMHELSVSWSIDKLVNELNKIQPHHIECFTSVMVALAKEKKSGNLKISPLRIGVICEPMFDQDLKISKEAFNCPVNNFYGASETGPHGLNGDDSLDLMACDDCVIIEPIDKNGKLVKDLEVSEKILVTSLINTAMPLIRYEITDQVCFCDDFFQDTNFRKLKPVTGRTDEGFVYKIKNKQGKEIDINIHRMTFADGLLRDAKASEYQVIQTKGGADIKIEAVSNLDINIDLIKSLICELLVKRGLSNPIINIEKVDKLPRHHETGKLKRFIKLKY